MFSGQMPGNNGRSRGRAKPSKPPLQQRMPTLSSICTSSRLDDAAARGSVAIDEIIKLLKRLTLNETAVVAVARQTSNNGRPRGRARPTPPQQHMPQQSSSDI